MHHPQEDPEEADKQHEEKEIVIGYYSDSDWSARLSEKLEEFSISYNDIVLGGNKI